ncbi:LysR family transcriptional regulator [Vibrio sinensis]|uniref:LysR family transcriptional regulator n=1 Tax=Vibrio sinensis TaxID=2302434 RepID=UPI001FB34186|nr:LysR family transcriptional regulator [Vibrio sinensis]
MNVSFDTRWLEDFLTLAEVRNFSKAAKLRHITQPAFGRRIKSLENAVSQQLIDRNSNPIKLTPAGKLFRLTAKAMIQQMEHGVAELKNNAQPMLSPVSIASPHTLSSPALIQLLDSIQEQQIPYSVDVLRVDLGIKALKDGQCDFFMGFDHIALLQPPFQNQLLGHGHYLLVSVADNGQARYSLEDKSVPYLRYTCESYSARLLEQHYSQVPDNFVSIFESSMCQLHKEMVLLGKGIAWLPDLLIKNELDQGTIVPLDPHQFNIPFAVRLYRYNTKITQEAEHVWQLIEDKYSLPNPFCTPWLNSGSAKNKGLQE